MLRFRWALSCCFVIGMLGSLVGQDVPAWQVYVNQETQRIAERSRYELASIDAGNWPSIKERWRGELREMLGLQPWPEKTDLKATTVGSIVRNGYRVDRLHYQSRPGLYVTANLYKPDGEMPSKGWPAVLYVCGHARVYDHGRLLGNKTSYQHHGIWLAKHGVVCLMIDTTQLGEFHGEHHGTYKLGRWDWYSKGFTPAGVEAWNAIRGIDLLTSLPEVNAEAIGVTGRSGGGAYSWFAAALDERIRVAVPVAGITDLENHVVDGCVEGHCDCMYFVNYFRWDYAQLAALVAPRALLLANSDSDGIFPLDGVVRIHRQLSKLYQSLGVPEKVGLLITPGPHKDTQELQVGAFKWLLQNLQDSEVVIDSPALKEFEPTELAVFEQATPLDERVGSVASWFVENPHDETLPEKSSTAHWLGELRRLGVVPKELEAWSPHEVARGGEGENAWMLWEEASPFTGQKLQVLQVGTEGPRHVHFMSNNQRLWSDGSVDAEMQKLAGLGPDSGRHFFVRWSGSTWFDGELSSKVRQIVRRFYLLGTTPEQLALGDYLVATRWLSLSEAGEVSLHARGRESGLALLVALILGDSSGGHFRLAIDPIPNEELLSPVLMGFSRVCGFDDLLKAAGETDGIRFEFGKQEAVAQELVDFSDEPHQSNGFRMVEVGTGSATIWVRATKYSLPNFADLPEVAFEKPAVSGKRNEGAILPLQGVDGLRFAVPGAKAEMRVDYRNAETGPWLSTPWRVLDSSTDFSTLFTLSELQPGTRYDVRTQVRSASPTVRAEDREIRSLRGSFSTLPPAGHSAEFRMAVGTCQAFDDRDGAHGFDAYRTMLRRGTDVFVMAGDVVYYDALARSRELANYHWQRTYSLSTLVEFHKQVPTYFLKDDHDTYVDDSWPGMTKTWMGSFTFEDGQEIFKQQTGLPEPAYRTFLVGSDLQVWLMEGRDYRSANTEADGPGKSIWGEEQKRWLQQTLNDSKAKFRIVISPTPLVGPDRATKKDNHSNTAFATEGAEVRQMLAEVGAISVCGDRHWQYHSVDEATGLHEFSVGPLSDRHAGGWQADDFRPEIHQYLRVGGGYLELDLTAEGELTVLHLDTAGRERHRYLVP